MPTCYTNAVFRTSRFYLKITAIEISSILKMSFVNMFMNSHFASSTVDEILSKTKLLQPKKLLFLCKVNEETQLHSEGYLSYSVLWGNWVVKCLQDKLDVKK